MVQGVSWREGCGGFGTACVGGAHGQARSLCESGGNVVGGAWGCCLLSNGVGLVLSVPQGSVGGDWKTTICLRCCWLFRKVGDKKHPGPEEERDA